VVIQPNQRAPLPFDAPNRFFAWGEFRIPWKLTVAPLFDVHTGFPYSVINQSHEFVGPRNEMRFPRSASTDLQILREVLVPFPGKEHHHARIGASVFNVFNRYDPATCKTILTVIASTNSSPPQTGPFGASLFWSFRYEDCSQLGDSCPFTWALDDSDRDCADRQSSSNADDIVERILQQDALRKAQLNGYIATRHYIAVNKQRRAEMLVEVACTNNNEKKFAILSEEGSSAIRKHVFYKMLQEETQASRHDTSGSTRITPANYGFQLLGKEVIDERPAYLLRVTPESHNKYLIDGRIWVDATDYSIVRSEGNPARSSSFWTRDVHFVHTYQKVGPFWLAASTHSVSEIRIFGEAELTIHNSNYTLNSPDNRTAKAEFPAGVAR
jgi:hypothetical protein